jgi:spore coat protein SA
MPTASLTSIKGRDNGKHLIKGSISVKTVYHLLDEREPFSEINGGAISRWAANTLRDGDEVVICPSFDTSYGFPIERLYELPRWSSVGTVHPIIYRSPWPLQRSTYIYLFQDLFQKVKRGDVVYVHNRPACAATLATVADKYGIQVVLHMHNSMLLQANRGQINALRHTPIVFCSEFLRKEAAAALPNRFEKTYIVYNGADGVKFRPPDRDRNAIPTVIFTGRLVPYKGVHVLLEAMRILEKNGVAAKCQIVGGSGFGNSKGTRYTRKLERLKPNNTELVGYKSGEALAEMLRNASIFSCPSIWNDPFPLAPLEAMATGLPVVASNVGGIPEALAYGGGLLVPPNNPEALADALKKLIEDPTHREEMGKKGHASYLDYFVWDRVRDQYELVIDELAKEVRVPLAATSNA